MMAYRVLIEECMKKDNGCGRKGVAVVGYREHESY